MIFINFITASQTTRTKNAAQQLTPYCGYQTASVNNTTLICNCNLRGEL